MSYCHFNSNVSDSTCMETPASRPRRRRTTESATQVKRRLALDALLRRKRARSTGDEQVNASPGDTVGVCEDDTSVIETFSDETQR